LVAFEKYNKNEGLDGSEFRNIVMKIKNIIK